MHSNKHIGDFRTGALLAWGMDNPQGTKPDLDEAEVQWLTKEFSKDTWDNFKIPLPMILTASKCVGMIKRSSLTDPTSPVLCGLSAVVQGMDQSAVNGAQEYVLSDYLCMYFYLTCRLEATRRSLK